MSRHSTSKGSGSYASSDNLQNEVTKLRSQIDIEKKARREAEEKYKQMVTKMDVLQQRLQDKNKEIEELNVSKEEVIKGNQTLEMTINRLEGYLRKKNTRLDIVNFDPDSNTQSTIDDILKSENELEKQFEQLMMEKQANAILEKRCALQEQTLREHNIRIDDSELEKLKTEVTSTELDF